MGSFSTEEHIGGKYFEIIYVQICSVRNDMTEIQLVRKTEKNGTWNLCRFSMNESCLGYAKIDHQKKSNDVTSKPTNQPTPPSGADPKT